MKNIFCILLFLISFTKVLLSQTGVEISTDKVIIEGEKYFIHTVAQGNTIYSICKAYGISEEDFFKANLEVKNTNLKLGQTLKIPILNELSADGKHIVYTVKAGDTVYSLCRKYGISEVDFYTINPEIKQGKALKLGQEIKFPYTLIEEKVKDVDKDTVNFIYYLVEKGETIYGISRNYEITKEELIKANPELENNKLLVGDLIKIPKNFENIKTSELKIIDSISKNDSNVKKNETFDNGFCGEQNWFKSGKNFEVIVLLPIDINSNLNSLSNQSNKKVDQRINASSEKIISFYAGFLVALEKFKHYDIKINLKVYDIGNDNTVINSLLNENKFATADMIVGPAYKSQVEHLNSNLPKSNATILLPFINHNDIPKRYSRNVLLKPSMGEVSKSIANFASENPEHHYFIIQGREAEQIELAELFYNDMQNKLGTNKNVNIIKFNGKNLENLAKLVSKDVENVFILPFQNEIACTNVFIDLFPLKAYSITLIGDQSILNYETIDPVYYLNSKFTYFSSINIDYSDNETKEFINKYKDIFLCEPDEYSFIAFDAISYWLLNLVKFGTDMGYCVSNNGEYNGISGKQNFVHRTDFANYSFSNSCTFLYSLKEDYSFEMIYPIIK